MSRFLLSSTRRALARARKSSLPLILPLFLLPLASCGSSKKVTQTEMTDAAPPEIVTQSETAPVEATPKEEPKVETAAEAAAPMPLILENVYFDFDKYDLTPTALQMLADNAGVLQAYPDVKVMIEGHCDERGTIEYNLALGDKRARAAKDYLISLGVDAMRIATISYGKERPVDPRHNEEAWAKNRRAAPVLR